MAPERSDELTLQMRAAVAERLRGRGGAGSAPGIQPRPHPQRPAPLSFAQQRLWLLHELFPDGLGYNVPSTHRLQGPIEVDALRRALSEVLRRHEVLRSTFDRDRDGHPVQVVRPAAPIELPVHRVPAGADPAALAVALVRRPFDLRSGPLLRADLLRLDTDHHVLVLCAHHIAVDQWSLEVLYAELSRLYPVLVAGQRAGREAELPALRLQYADYAVWQREHLTTDRLRPHLDFWHEHLDGVPEQRLRIDRPRPGTQSFAGARLRRRVPEPVLRKLREVSARHGATTFATLLAALHTLLTGYADDPDLTIAIPFGHRSRPELEPLLGFFVNTLPLRTTPAPGRPWADPTFADLLHRSRDVTLDALLHQDLPFDRLVHHLHPQRALSHNPITQVALSHFNTRSSGPRLPGVEVRPFPIEPGTVVFDLDFVMAEYDDGLAIELDYSTDLFDEATARGMLDQFAGLLDRIPADPSRRLGELVPRKLRTSTAGSAAAVQEPGPRSVEAAARTAPRTDTEHALVAIWTKVLGVDAVGTTDDFFAIGGDSLAAARVAALVSRRFGVRVPMRAMFDAPTISRFATEVLAPLLAPRPAPPPERGEPADRTERLARRLAALPEAEARRVLHAARESTGTAGHRPIPQEDQ